MDLDVCRKLSDDFRQELEMAQDTHENGAVGLPNTRISGANPVFEDSELVLGLVAPVGTNFDKFENLLERCLRKFGYAINPIRLSKLTNNFQVEPNADTPGASKEALRLHRMMHAGNYLRFTSERGEFLALAAAARIRAGRPAEGVLPRTAHIVRSLKHPDEVRALRRIYGAGFYLIGVAVAEEQRRSYLHDDKGCSADEVDKLLQRDAHEEDARFIGPDGQNYGQRTRDTFHLADVFVPLDDEVQFERFLRVVFGYPFETPTRDEYAMFLAFGASLRSGDLSRQVGAVVVTAAGDVVAVGANDVPRAGGGLYWSGTDDQRDHRRGMDSNEARREQIIIDVLQRLRPGEVPEQDWIVKGKRLLKGSLLMDITEYGRAAHAEMEALLSCARSGVSTRGCTLYSTTFPCHNCAKHIIAAGVVKVVYVEPYPKSQARDLLMTRSRSASRSRTASCLNSLRGSEPVGSSTSSRWRCLRVQPSNESKLAASLPAGRSSKQSSVCLPYLTPTWTESAWLKRSYES